MQQRAEEGAKLERILQRAHLQATCLVTRFRDAESTFLGVLCGQLVGVQPRKHQTQTV
jgi:hypothetical protein